MRPRTTTPLVDKAYGQDGRTACAPLVHPLRSRIIEVANERKISAAQFVDEGLAPAGVHFKDREHARSHVSHHFRELEKDGLIYLVEEIPRRGASEKVYAGKTKPMSAEEFEELSLEERRNLSRIALQNFIARACSAQWADTFDKRAERVLAWVPLQLDEGGWSEVVTALEDCFERVQAAASDAEERLEDAGEDQGIPVTLGLFGFESPPPPTQRLRREAIG